MSRLKPLNFNAVILLPIYVVLIFSMSINGWNLLAGSNDIHLQYLNIYNKATIGSYPDYYNLLLTLTAVLQLLVPVLLMYSLLKKEFLKNKASHILSGGF
ncbi:hypothetical protein SAMN06265379_103205 [Saccharicrinis carchari]|uniref:Uncharacterized protein n=1 Tax=Saccharicrinis carchari TaxID=1168039 RepID=A0A521CJF5_SACCC|nr:hypothetical protein [Saccharicrinis carchari]SMO59515.1 hypothetical protein SAMN06265379_103205 [Saccharicrinis carchari]